MNTETSFRGFAAMNHKRQREIASMGGKAAQAKGTGRRWTVEEARAAGRKGGLNCGASKRGIYGPKRKAGLVLLAQGADVATVATQLGVLKAQVYTWRRAAVAQKAVA